MCPNILPNLWEYDFTSEIIEISTILAYELKVRIPAHEVNLVVENPGTYP